MFQEIFKTSLVIITKKSKDYAVMNQLLIIVLNFSHFGHLFMFDTFDAISNRNVNQMIYLHWIF